MIPTRYKSKLSRDLSYPIGAEAISAALAAAPHAEVVTLTFSDSGGWPASRFRQVLVDRSPSRILTLRYQPSCKPGFSGSNDMVAGGWYREKWELMVYPVLREFRHLANRLLREEGLPAVATWLGSSRQAGWDSVPRQLGLIFNPAGGCLDVDEFAGV